MVDFAEMEMRSLIKLKINKNSKCQIYPGENEVSSTINIKTSLVLGKESAQWKYMR